MRVVYAFGTALFNRYPHIGQGEANAALTPHVLRKLGYRNAREMVRIAEALEAFPAGAAEADAPARAADALARLFADLGMPTRLRELEVPESGLEAIVADSMKNFNADPKREFLQYRAELVETLRACW